MSFWSSVGNILGKVGSWLGGSVGSSAMSAATALVSNATQMKYQKELMGLQYDYNAKLSDKNLEQSKALQQFQNDYTTKMASTAHQIEVDDMRKAGLNPILSATGGNGASFGTGGATISSGTASSGQAPEVDYLSSALALRQQKNQNKQTDSIVDLQNDQAARTRMETRGQAWKNMQDQYTYDELQPLQKELLKQQINASAAQARNYDANSLAATINAYANQEASSAQAYFNRHRALGFSESTSDNYTGTYGGSIGPVKYNQTRGKGVSRSRTW